MSQDELHTALASWGIGVCLFISATSWMLMKFGGLMSAFDTDFDLGLYKWIVGAYIVCEVTMIPVAGKLVDHYGEKRILAIGAVFFIFGSVLCSCALSVGDMVIFRCIQGTGAGIIFAVAFSSVGMLYRQHKRNYAHEIMTGAFAIGSLYGTMIGWWFIQNLSWRASLLTVAAVMFVGAILAYKNLPEREVKPNVDVKGIFLLGLLFLTVMMFTQLANNKFPLFSWNSFNFVAGVVILILLLVIVEKKAVNPALPLQIKKVHVKFILAMAALCFFGIGLIQFIMKFMLLYYSLSIYNASFMFIFLLGGGAISSMVGCRKVTHTGIRLWIVLGSCLTIFAFALMAWVGSMGIPYLALCLVVLGLGLGCMVTQILCAMQGIVPKKDMAMYTSDLMGIRMLFICLGNVLYGYYIKTHLHDILEMWGVGDVGGDIMDIISYIVYVAGGLGEELINTFSSSLHTCALLAGAMFAVVAIVGLWIKKEDLKISEELLEKDE